MIRKKSVLLFAIVSFFYANVLSQSLMDSIVLHDLLPDKSYPAGMAELTIPSSGSLLQGFVYKANGGQKHPTLLLLHGYPGNERNLDLAQVVRSKGWNVVYFDYRGSWGSQGQFSFRSCVEDVVNVVAYCKKYGDSLRIDTSNIVLFGHSMGAWVCIKSLETIDGIKKGFALSTWDIDGPMQQIHSPDSLTGFLEKTNAMPGYFVLNTPVNKIFAAEINDHPFHSLLTSANGLKGKQLRMLDEHPGNKELAAALGKINPSGFRYEVWQTDHPFTNKRVSLIKLVVDFLEH